MATAIIGTLKHLPKASILPTLPETGRPNRIYFIPNEDPTEDNRYNEYLWVKDETYPDGHWELVGPTTIDLTDYATKEEVSDLEDSIGEQIKKYLPLSGGTMDKGSNISFPLDSGSTVYNGSGISVGGKASTDILHAAGGTTKIKTLNGESMLGEGNIVINPSSVPVSLSWYNRTLGEGMVAEARLKSKNFYKVELYLLKIMPMVIALAYLVNTVSSYFGVDIPILASIAGMSLIPLIFMYISSYVFKFCEYHRMFLHYIAVNDIINIYDWYIGISVTNRELFVLHMSITGISLFIILYLYVKSHKKLIIEDSR